MRAHGLIRFAVAVALLIGVTVVAGMVQPALAQNSDVRQLINRLDRVQRELTTLQRHVYRGGATPKPRKAGAVAFPPSGTLDPSVAARLEVRLTQLETELRNMTGLTEELNHAVRQFNSRLAKLVSDIDTRLSAIERSRASALAGQSTPGGGANPKTSSRTPPGGAGTLGVLPRDAVSGSGSKSGKGSQTAKARKLPKGPPKKQYDYAISLMLEQQNFGAAEKALRAFIAANPSHGLTSNAHYWLGETYYVRKNYQQAAFAFADGFQKFPRASKAADSLLKLGMSLGHLGRRNEACTAFSRLLDNFPKVRGRLKARVSRQQRKLKCA